MKMIKKENVVIIVVVCSLLMSLASLVAIAQVSNSSIAMPFRRILAFVGLNDDAISQHKAEVERLTQLASIPEGDKHVYDGAGNRVHWTQERINNALGLIQGHYDRLEELGEGAWLYEYVPDDTTRPSVTIVSPQENDTVSGTIIVSVNATDNVGVVRVEFYIDDVSVAVDSVAPYEYSWDTTSVANGQHTVDARAYDELNSWAQRRHLTVEN